MPFDIGAQDERRPHRWDDEAFEPEAVAAERAGHEPPVCALNDALPPSARSPALALFAFGAAPCAYARARFKLGQLAGAVLLPEVDLSGNRLAPSSQDRSCYLYRVTLEKGVAASAGETPAEALLFVCQYMIRPERARAWCECVLRAIKPTYFLLLDEQPWHPPQPEGSELGPCIRALETRAHKEARKEALLPAPPLEPIGMIGGTSAALLEHCEAEGQPALLLLVGETVDDSLYDDMLGLEAALSRHVSSAGLPAASVLAAVIRPLGDAEEARKALWATAASLHTAVPEPSSDMFA